MPTKKKKGPVKSKKVAKKKAAPKKAQAKKNPAKVKKAAERTPLPKKTTPKKKAAAKKSPVKLKKVAQKQSPAKKSLPKKKTTAKKTAPKKRQALKKSRVRGSREILGEPALEPGADAARTAGQSGSLQGLSDVAEADSESVDELLEEGNAFEAEAVQGVESVPDADEGEVRTHEVPEDDVPEEYLEPDNPHFSN